MPSTPNSLAYVFYDLSMGNVINNEKVRVEARKTLVNDVYELKKRKDFLISSQTARTLAKLKMLFVVFLLIVFSFGMFNARRVFPFFSELAVVIFTLSVLSIGIIYLSMLFVDHLKRDRIDYSELDFSLMEDINKTKKDEKDELTDETSLYDLLKPNALKSTCIGSACCPAGTTFVGNKCV